MLVNFILLFNESCKLDHRGTIIKIGPFCFQRFTGRYAAVFCKSGLVKIMLSIIHPLSLTAVLLVSIRREQTCST